jgi:hypothetical protein
VRGGLDGRPEGGGASRRPEGCRNRESVPGSGNPHLSRGHLRAICAGRCRGVDLWRECPAVLLGWRVRRQVRQAQPLRVLRGFRGHGHRPSLERLRYREFHTTLQIDYSLQLSGSVRRHRESPLSSGGNRTMCAAGQRLHRDRRIRRTHDPVSSAATGSD